MKGGRRSSKLFILSSPSGGGKTTVVRALLRRLPNLVRSVSVTTRPRRPAERDGSDYRFISLKAFQQLKTHGELLEWAKVHQAYYGTPRTPVERALARGRDCILCIDVQGARQLRRRFGSRAILVFLLPPTLDDLKSRLVKRQTDTPEAIRKRLLVAQRELSCVQWYDYAVVNRKLSQAIAQLKAIVIAERSRVKGRGHRDTDPD